MKFVTSLTLFLSLLSPVTNAQFEDYQGDLDGDFEDVPLDDVDDIGGFQAFGSSGVCYPTSCEECVKCTGITDNGDGSKTVHISTETCKDGRNVLWFCCEAAGPEGYEQQGACRLVDCPRDYKFNNNFRCYGSNTYTYSVPDTATHIRTELFDNYLTPNGCPNTRDSNSNRGFCINNKNGFCSYGANGKCHEPHSKSWCKATIDLSTCPCDGCATGDPHFKTWAGQWYDYHGQCDLVFLKEPTFADGLGLDIHIRTTARDDFSFIESAAIRIGTDVLEVGGWGEHLLNGVDGAEFPAHLGPFPIHYEMENKKKHHFEIPYGEGKSIQIHTVKDLVAVQMVNASAFDFQNSGGMMGQFGTGKLIGRDGKTEFGAVLVKYHRHNEFGQEWQVREDEPKLFDDSSRHPQAPAKCILPEKKAATQRRLGETSINREDAEKACAHWGDAKEHCIFDVMAMNDLEVAEFHGAF